MPSPTGKRQKLIQMALDRFGELTEAELKLFTAVANGQVAEFRIGTGAVNHPAYVNQWADDRLLQADRIAWLCGIADAENLLTKRGIQIRGAKISGPMQLDYSVIDGPLAFSHCAFNDSISLQHVKARMVDIQLTHCKSINATGAYIDGPMFLRNGFRAMVICLSNAQITGDFLLDHSQLVNLGGDAIQANGLKVAGTFAANSSRIAGRVNLYQVKVGGNLDLFGTKLFNPEKEALIGTGAEIGGAAFFNGDFRAAGTVNLQYATIGGDLECSSGRFLAFLNEESAPGQSLSLNIENTRIVGNVRLTNKFVSHGLVNLHGSNIGGHFDCENGHFRNPNGVAILGNNAQIAGGVLLRRGFDAAGEIRFFAATINGNFECDGGNFVNPTGKALDVERAQISGHTSLSRPFTARGMTSFYSATIRGDLRCQGGQFMNPDQDAFSIEKADVSGSVMFSYGFRAEGAVSLIRTRIGGNLECIGGEFLCPENKNHDIPREGSVLRCALQAESANVTGSIIVRSAVECEGTGQIARSNGIFHLLRAKVGGNVEFQRCALVNESGKALVLVGAKIDGDLTLGPRFHAQGSIELSRLEVGGVCTILECVLPEKITALDLRFSNVTTMQHLSDSWPDPEKLLLDGLKYKNVFVELPSPKHWKRCLDWVRLQPKKSRALQPYEQLASVLRLTGYESEAKEVLIAKHQDSVRHGVMSRAFRAFLKYVMAYGYKPEFAFRWILLMLAISWFVFKLGHDHGLMVATNRSVSKEAYPKFHALVYSGEFFVPIMDLRQKNYWAPNERKGHIIIGRPFYLRWGYVLTVWYWVQTFAGWVLTTLWVAAFSGLVRRLS